MKTLRTDQVDQDNYLNLLSVTHGYAVRGFVDGKFLHSTHTNEKEATDEYEKQLGFINKFKEVVESND